MVCTLPPARGVCVCLLLTVVCYQTEVSTAGRSLIQNSPTVCVCVCVCVCVSFSVTKCNVNSVHLK